MAIRKAKKGVTTKKAKGRRDEDEEEDDGVAEDEDVDEDEEEEEEDEEEEDERPSKRFRGAKRTSKSGGKFAGKKSKFKSDLVKISGLWEMKNGWGGNIKEDQDIVIEAGEFTIPAGARLLVFPNDYKKKDNDPDYNLFITDTQEQ